jgi:hypothetical protein
MERHLREALKSPIVIFALACALLGAPLLALGTSYNSSTDAVQRFNAPTKKE